MFVMQKGAEYNHPDLHIVMPLPFEKEHKSKDDGSKEVITKKVGFYFVSHRKENTCAIFSLSFVKEESGEKGDAAIIIL